MRALPAILLGAVACADCEVEPPPLAACMAPDDGLGMPEGDPLILTSLGDVVGAGRGVPSGSCLEGSPSFGETPTDFLAPDARWVRLQDNAAGRVWLAVVMVEATALWPTRGDVVELRYGVNDAEAVVPAVTLELRTRSGELLFFAGQAETVGGLGLPSELGLTLGDKTCTLRDACGRAAQHALEVELDSRSEAVQPGEVVEMGDFLFVHGGAEVDSFGDQAACEEGGSRVRVAAVR